MFDNLTNKLEAIFSNLKKAPSLNKEQVESGLKEIRLALLEADVALPVVKQFLENIKPKAIGQEIIRSTSPGQMIVKIVNDELINILGVKNQELNRIIEKDLLRSKYFKKRYSKNVNSSILKDYNIIINCNYFNNFTNKYFGKKIIKEYDSIAYTTIINHDKILNNTATQIFTKKGPLAFLPISNTQTSIVYSFHNSVKKKMI